MQHARGSLEVLSSIVMILGCKELIYVVIYLCLDQCKEPSLMNDFFLSYSVVLLHDVIEYILGHFA